MNTKSGFSLIRVGGNDMELEYHGRKPANKSEALKRSIEKWHILSIGRDFDIYDGGIETCGLCALYFNNDCAGCPVFKKTGRTHCRNTPYYKYVEATRAGEPTAAVRQARRELAFLEELK